MRYSNYLERSRHNVFYFRYPLPSPLHRTGKSKHVKVSLHTCDQKEALQLSRMLNYHASVLIEHESIRYMDHGDIVNLLKDYFYELIAQKKDQIHTNGPLGNEEKHTLIEDLTHVNRAIKDDTDIIVQGEDMHTRLQPIIEKYELTMPQGSADYLTLQSLYKHAFKGFCEKVLSHDRKQREFLFNTQPDYLKAVQIKGHFTKPDNRLSRVIAVYMNEMDHTKHWKTKREATLARERERALSQRSQLTVFLVLLSIAVVLVMAVYFAAQRRSNARLQQSLDARLRALTQTSHELRNPIGGVLGLSELLLKTPINAAQRSMVEATRAAGSTIEKLAQDLLDRGRIESGRLSLSLQPASLQLLAESLYQLHLPRAREKGLTLQLDLGPDLPELVMADAERLQQVLSNLLGNSLKFIERGAINLSLRVRARSNDNRVRVSFAVRDTGPGNDADEIERLFEPFAKGRAGQRHRAGAGLGLAISADRA